MNSQEGRSRDFWWRDYGLASMDRPIGPRRRPARWMAVGTAFLLPYLIPAVQNAFSQDMPTLRRILLLALIAFYAGAYLFFPKLMPGQNLRRDLSFVVVMVAAGLAQLLFMSANSVGLMAYSMALVALILPPGWVLVVDGSATAILLVLLVARGEFSEGLGDVITVVSIAGALFFMGRLIRAIRDLRMAQKEIAALAVASERERVARDLHDILGHSLTTITVKAGLARRMLESSNNVDGAINELRDVESLTRSALSDVRATVSEYREVSLPAELAGARAALRAAEIAADLPRAVDNVRPELQRVFGYVLREAVTNVIRHSQARSVTVRVGRNWIEVRDDGVATGTMEAGNGLRGLSERLKDVGGVLHTDTGTEGGLMIRAEVPVDNQDHAEVKEAVIAPNSPLAGTT